MSNSNVRTNIPVRRLPFAAGSVPPNVPYTDGDNVGGPLQFTYVRGRKVIGTDASLGGTKADGKKYFLYMENGQLREDTANTVEITPVGDGTVPVARVTIDGVTQYIKAGSGGGGQSINTLDVPLLTPMFFDYNYYLSGDSICWIPSIHYLENTATQVGDDGYKSMYFGRHQVTQTADTDPNSQKSYYVYDGDIDDYRACIANDFNTDGSFKESGTYYEFEHRGYRLIYNHLRKDFDDATDTTTKSDTYTLSTGSTVTVSYRLADDGHKIVICRNDADVESIVNKLDLLYNDPDIGTAWYYVLDTNRKRFRLPRTRYGLHGDKTYVKTAQKGNASLFLYFHTGNKGESSDDSMSIDDIFDIMYPVGSVYIFTVYPLPDIFTRNGRRWKFITDRCLWGTGKAEELDTFVEEGLPLATDQFVTSVSLNTTRVVADLENARYLGDYGYNVSTSKKDLTSPIVPYCDHVQPRGYRVGIAVRIA